eukprot:scaffold3134_cov414-Prasinococcus_capsulatus_cf.AAC.24
MGRARGHNGELARSLTRAFGAGPVQGGGPWEVPHPGDGRQQKDCHSGALATTAPLCSYTTLSKSRPCRPAGASLPRSARKTDLARHAVPLPGVGGARAGGSGEQQSLSRLVADCVQGAHGQPEEAGEEAEEEVRLHYVDAVSISVPVNMYVYV